MLTLLFGLIGCSNNATDGKRENDIDPLIGAYTAESGTRIVILENNVTHLHTVDFTDIPVEGVYQTLADNELLLHFEEEKLENMMQRHPLHNTGCLKAKIKRF